MNKHFSRLAKDALMGLSLAIVCGGFTACTDDYDLDDEGNYPSWLGGSIYEALKNPTSLESSGTAKLTGTFNNYLRLIDDLGEKETLGKTGSKTVFPANDEAFERFFANNSWGVSKYEDLNDDQKKRLLYASMLDNALLVEMLSNVPDNSEGATGVVRGQAMRHSSAINITNTIVNWGKADMPVNNKYWERFYNNGLHLVADATDHTMIHFTEEQMTANGITTRGDQSDFEVLTGQKYDPAEHSAYIFRNKIINPDVTCKNGYIHQMQDVLVPPGNMGEVIRNSSNTTLFSRMLDRFSAPYWGYKANAVTQSYNSYAQQNNLERIDSIFELRYMSAISHANNNSATNSASNIGDPNNSLIDLQYVLPYDPGWNAYNSGNLNTDIAAMFVPTDEALEDYFLKGGGESLIISFGSLPNTKENLPQNIDSIPLQNVLQIIGNLMKKSFVGTVPSKFGHVMDEANDPMGLSVDALAKNEDGTYDVKIANNGVIYMLNKMFAPPSLVAVSAPVTLNKNMRIMNTAVNDGKNTAPLGLDVNYYAYLLAMSANYGFFIPTDEAFGKFYVDPTSLSDKQPRALRFYYKSTSPFVACSQWKYDPATNTVTDSIGVLATSAFRSQLIDILNYHTVVLGAGEKLGDKGNKYYKTKHGAGIVFTGSTVKGGDISVNDKVGAPVTPVVAQINRTLNQANGTSYEIDHVIQAPQQSVYAVISSNPQLSDFSKLCNWSFTISDGDNFNEKDLMGFASDRLIEITMTKKERYQAYKTFLNKNGLDFNVNYFNSYNYTVYAPDNTAMQKAFDQGLPTWDEVKAVYDRHKAAYKKAKEDKTDFPAEVSAARDTLLAMIYEINDFVRYHFQDNTVFADNVVETGDFPTACSDTLGIRQKLQIGGGGHKITVRDDHGQTITINGNDDSKLSNVLTRDYVLNKTNHTIQTSSFAAIHQISTPLNPHKVVPGKHDGTYGYRWKNVSSSRSKARLRAFRNKFESYLYKMYDATLNH